ncbi:MAG: diguanylate cyclase domain-containing protein [Vibrio sp.]
MELTSHTRRYIIIFFLSLLLLGIMVVESINYNQQRTLRNTLLQHAKEELSAVSFQLEAEVLGDIYAVKSLTTFLVLDPELKLYFWDQLAAAVIRRSDHLGTLAIAPRDVIAFSYPLPQASALLGLDYRDLPEQWRSIQKAREVRETFVSGPVDLVQGGRGLVIREPIFYDPPNNKRYWGVLSVVMDWDSLISATNLHNLAHHFHVAIRGQDSQGSQGDVFWGEPQVFAQAFAIQTIDLPYGSWQIAIAEAQDLLQGLPWYERHLVRILGYSTLLLLVLGFVVMVRLYHVAEARSLHDPLTQLPNRRYFISTIEEYFDNAKRSANAGHFALLNIDINHFKQINDSYGHGAGDQILIACAARIKSSLRAFDFVARMGGDEFLVLLPRIDQEKDVLKICDTILDHIAETPIVYEDKQISLRVSIGYALYDQSFINPDGMFKLADQRMYAAKRRQNTPKPI